jgi:hypothetical protein
MNVVDTFECAVCGKQLRAPTGAAGRSFRCPLCGTLATVPGNSFESASVSTDDTAHSEADLDPSPTLSRQSPNWIVRLTVAMIGIAVLAISAIVYFNIAADQRDAEESARLTSLVDDRVNSAKSKVERFDFSGARSDLEVASTELAGTPLESIHVMELRDSVTVTRSKLDAREKEYQQRLEDGWVLFDGRLIRQEEKARLVAERKEREERERRQREAAEARRRAAAQRAAEERERRRREAAAEELKLDAYIMSQEFVKRRLKAPSTARFPRYEDRDVIVTFSTDTSKFTVLAWVEAQNAFGVFLRSSYLCSLWPTGGDNWQSDSVILD